MIPTQKKYVYTILHKQILVMIYLSVLPGLGYIFLGWLNNIIMPALIWYGLILLISLWGYRLHKEFYYDSLNITELSKWHKKLSYFFYLIFAAWTLIFILYANETESKMHYIAIFTELGASVVATTLLFSDKKTMRPILLMLMLPLAVYFTLIGEFYGYVLAIFALTFMGVLFYAGNSSDQLIQRTHYQATHDQLTRLYNRHAFIEALQQKINGLSDKQNYSYLLLIDLDHFKTINDSLGHDIGDQVLQEVSARLQNIAAKDNIIARLGGDEFVLLGRNFSNKEESLNTAIDISEKLLESLKATYAISDHHLYISASIGVSLLTGENLNANAFIKEADIAMYEVKDKGRDGVILFNDELSKRVEKHLDIEQKLHFALGENEIYLQYQPQLNLEQRVIGCEALVRWKNKELGMIGPNVFIPVAEQTGFIVELGQYILEESFKTLKKWDEEGIGLEQFSINISVRQFVHHNFITDIKRLCLSYLNKELQSKLVFEMTETLLAEDIPKVISIMNELKRSLGIKFSMDDFGTGYSSLSYLQQMPIDELKIDRSFIDRLYKDATSKKMVDMILTMAKNFELKVVAEGVETAEQCKFLTDRKCDILQGYFFSQPVDKDTFVTYYHSMKPVNYII